MIEEPSRIEIFFSKLFSKNILEIELVSTILYTISLRLNTFKERVDKITNTDI